ncbi:hypothetical protein GCM10027589_03920 [Actinocorallia lasiicapitis]
MDSGTVGYEDEDFDDTYWRRRAIALGAALLAVGGVVYACSGGDDKTPIENAAVVATSTASATPTPTALATTFAPPPPLPTVTATVTQQVTVPAPRRPGDACAPADVVATLTPVRPEFAKGDAPQFQLTVVNTGKLDCTFDAGGATFVTKVRSGSDRVWSSAHCAPATSIQLLRRGVPFSTAVGWDRRRSAQGCQEPRAKARPGTYTVQTEGGGVRTEKSVFVLR